MKWITAYHSLSRIPLGLLQVSVVTAIIKIIQTDQKEGFKINPLYSTYCMLAVGKKLNKCNTGSLWNTTN